MALTWDASFPGNLHSPMQVKLIDRLGPNVGAAYTLIALGNAGFWVRKCVGTYSQLVYPRQVPHVLGRGVSTFAMFS